MRDRSIENAGIGLLKRGFYAGMLNIPLHFMYCL